jgi:galactoside O-acetyltransferase
VIEDDVWLGAGVVVVDGVRIGQGSVIGAGAVVSQDIPPYSIAVGSPAKPMKNRKSLETMNNGNPNEPVYFGALESMGQ